ncbi:MAG: YegP family protein [Kosmotogaceae bacterium]
MAMDNAKFEVYKDSKGEYRFRLKAPNGEIIAASEGYTSKQACLNGIDTIKKYALSADVEEI